MGAQLSPPQKGAEPPKIFGPYMYCAKTAGLIKMALGVEVGLDPSDIVLDGDHAPPPQKRGKESPQFSDHVYCGHGRPSQLLLSSCCVISATSVAFSAHCVKVVEDIPKLSATEI